MKSNRVICKVVGFIVPVILNAKEVVQMNKLLGMLKNCCQVIGLFMHKLANCKLFWPIKEYL